MHKPKYHVFVCTSSRITGQQRGYCFSKDAVAIVQSFMEEIETRELTDEVMVTNTGCFGISLIIFIQYKYMCTLKDEV